MKEIKELVMQTIISISGAEQESEEVVFELSDGRKFKMWHSQDCCEHVRLEDIEGDISDLINTPIIQATEETNSEEPHVTENDSFTWTFYRFATIKGFVVLRWLGTSNGYYSESVCFEQMG